MTEKERHAEILRRLEEKYIDVKCGLNYESPFELLVATMLSAQSTDKQVNKVTSELFKKYSTPMDFAGMQVDELKKYVKSCGYYNSKANNIIETAKMIISEYGGKVPDTLEELTRLPGVGRKTANVVLSNAFGVDAIAVDTHVFRVAGRLGLSNAKDVEKTEQDLMRNIPKDKWSRAHHWLIWHGRQVCHARKPDCAHCPLWDLCPSGAVNLAAKTDK